MGGLDVPSLCAVSVGTWPMNTHNGIWYNLENYYGDEFSETESVYAIQLLNETQLNTLNTQIKRASNDDWSYTNNCSSFAARMWNLNSEFQVSAGIIPTPTNLKNSILNDAGGSYRIRFAR